MNRLSGLSALALLAGLTACGSPEPAAEEQAPAAEMAMDGPFAASEMAMDTAMKAAVGVDAADSWVKKMIAHHDGAITMSRAVLALDPTADVARMAQMTIENQGAENDELRELAREGSPDPASAELYAAPMRAMHEGMMGASGGTPSETYLRKMMEHHRGAVAMSDIALANGATGAVRAQIEETRAEQQAEIAMVEAMLRGEPMPMRNAQAAPAAATPVQRAATPRAAVPAAKPATRPAAAPKPAASPTTPTAGPDEHAGHDMSDMDPM